MKKCYKCNQIKDSSDFYKNKSKWDGLCTECKTCQKTHWTSPKGKRVKQKSNQKYRQTPEGKASHCKDGEIQRLKFPEKKKAHLAVSNEIAAGRMERPSICEGCFQEKFVEGHHWSYEEENWLDVEWLCGKCHTELHKELLLV